MKLATVFATFVTVAFSVSAAPGETNAQRMARGLPPLPPVRRATSVSHARRSTPSGTPPSCGSGNMQCCNSLTDSTDPLASALLGLLGVVLGSSNVGVGLTCSPLAGSTSCSQQTVCCDNNSFNGLIAIGCTPININL